MPIINRMAELQDEITQWRRQIHANPELMYDVHETAAMVEQRLVEFGCDEVVTGIGRTGVVGIIKGASSTSGRTVGLRADMDALPIVEATGKPYASENTGKMHACGHDGHTAMLLGAAKYLAETRNFNGNVAVIFQPAEEGGAGGKAMVDDGMMDRFNIDEVYGMHNMPGLDVGEFSIREGGIMASTSEFDISIKGRGAHAAMPHQGVDPIVAASSLVTALQTIVSRNTNPVDSLVVTVTKFNAGNAHNVIPGEAKLAGTIRCLDEAVWKLASERIENLVKNIAEAHGCIGEINLVKSYPVTFNHSDNTQKAIAAARKIAGDDRVDGDANPVLGGEDFSFMLEARPGAFIFIGNGDTAGLHHPEYDFNDEVIPHGCSYWIRLVEDLLPA